MKNRIFAPGPTPLPEEVRSALAEPQPYHRSAEFGAVISSVSSYLQKLIDVDWPFLFFSASGTGAMQAAGAHLVNTAETVLVIDSGKFGNRWKRLLTRRGCEVISYEIAWGHGADLDKLEDILNDNPRIETVFATMVETSTLTRHPVEKIGALLAEKDKLFIVDAISALGSEPLYPDRWKIDVLIGASQKGLMTPPGLSFLTVSPAAEDKIKASDSEDFYFDLELALERMRHDCQTTWTPPIGLIKGLNAALKLIFAEGPGEVFARHLRLARLCRRAVAALGAEILSENPAVAGTPVLLPDNVNAEKVRELMYSKYNTFVPGGQQKMKGKLLRIGHLGYVDYPDLVAVISVLELALVELGVDVKPGCALQTMQILYSEEYS